MTGQGADLVRTLHEAAVARAIPVWQFPDPPPGDPLARVGHIPPGTRPPVG